MAFASQSQEFSLAIDFHQKGDLRSAEKYYRKSLKKNPRLIDAYLNLGLLQIDQQRATDGIRTMERGLEMDPKHSGLLSALSSTFLSMGQNAAARIHTQALVDHHPNKAEAYYNLANLDMMDGADEQALKLYGRAIELDVRLSSAYYNKGLIHYRLQQNEEAQQCFEKCIEIDPTLLAAKINLGRVMAEQANYLEAERLLREAVEKDPANANAHQQLGMVLHIKTDLAGAEAELLRAFELSGENSELHTLLGNVYRDYGDEKKSLHHYQKAVELDPENQLAKANLDVVNGASISTWHIDMLADGERNRAYNKTIQANINEGDIVFDIGAGTGLLSMMSARAGAKKVLAIELMEVIADCASEIIKDNKLEDKIEVLQMRSTALEEGKNFDEKADVIVSEIVDSTLIGEGVIPTIRHAKANLLKPGGKIIPASASIECMAVEIDDLQKTYKMDDVEGFDLSAFKRFVNQDNSRMVSLRTAPHKVLSEPQEVRFFDFYNLEDIASVMDPHRKTFKLKITEDGELQGLAFWFRMNLDENTQICSGPNGNVIHWDQMVSFINKPMNVKKGEEYTFEVCNSDTRIWFEKQND